MGFELGNVRNNGEKPVTTVRTWPIMPLLWPILPNNAIKREYPLRDRNIHSETGISASLLVYRPFPLKNVTELLTFPRETDGIINFNPHQPIGIYRGLLTFLTFSHILDFPHVSHLSDTFLPILWEKQGVTGREETAQNGRKDEKLT